MNELSTAVRFLNLTAMVVLAGGFGFALLIARPAYRDAKAAFLSYLQPQLRIARWCLLAMFALAFAGLWLQALYIGEPGGPDATGFGTAFPLLLETRFGRVWLLRIALLAMLSGLFAWATQAELENTGMLLVAGFTLSACLLVASALAGHASAAEGPGMALLVTADMLHLLACALWIGGLLPLVLLLRGCHRKGDAAAYGIATAVTQGFSRLALACVAVLIATGSYNAWQLVGGFAPLFGTAYGKLLLLKVAFLLLLLGLGAVNLFYLKPKIIESHVAGLADTAAHLGRLARNVRIEMVIGLGILLIVAQLGLTPPARHIQPDWPFPFRWDWSVIEKAPDLRYQVMVGLLWIAAGLAAILGAAVWKRSRAPAALTGLGLCIYGGASVLVSVSIDAYPTTYMRPAATYQAISIDQGRRLYMQSGCPACHGQSGYGDGPMGAGLAPRPADLTAPHANSHTAGDLFWWISHGVRQSAMPRFADRLSEEERWDLINFLRALSDSERARSLAPVIEGEPWLIAPDFNYSTGVGDSRTLGDYRGDRSVLLVLPGPHGARDRLEQLAIELPRLRAAGIEIIVVPDSLDASNGFPALSAREGLREITVTYALFARSILDDNLLAAVPHVEYLVDRQGYIRARWLPSEGDAWRIIDDLLAQAEILRTENPRAPAPDWHVH